MKRKGKLYEQLCDINNLWLADAKAQRGKLRQPGVIAHNKNRAENLEQIRQELVNKTYRTSPYHIFTIREPKERVIYRLPYRDRIVQHAIMNLLEEPFVSSFTADTYSCIKGRGIHGAQRALKRALKDINDTTYCLKLDIKKFYPSVDHAILKERIRRKIKDNDLLELLDGIIDSADGLPIGNYLSQYLANYYLSGFDHWLKEVKRVKYYFRYADDMVILSGSKQYLNDLQKEIAAYLGEYLKLEVKNNWQIFPVDIRGIDFVGYVFRHKYILVRKSTKQNYARMMKRQPNKQSIAAYNGWLQHCDSKHLRKKLSETIT